jgi:hypothetical protein
MQDLMERDIEYKNKLVKMQDDFNERLEAVKRSSMSTENNELKLMHQKQQFIIEKMNRDWELN